MAFIMPYLVIFMLLSSAMAFMLSPTQPRSIVNEGTYSRLFDIVPNGVQDGPKSEVGAIPTSHPTEAQEKEFVLISDSTGLTVQTAMSKCLSQFDWSDDECLLIDEGEICKITKKVHSFIRSEEAILRIVQEAKEN